jgi:hypothetical protein
VRTDVSIEGFLDVEQKAVANSYFGYELLYVNICLLVASSKKEVATD